MVKAKNSRSPVKQTEKKPPAKKPQPQKEFKIPKLTFRKNGVTYKEGDHVEVVQEASVYSGILTDILSSQLVVNTEKDIYKFFFHRGVNIRKVKGR